ncbi:hypothetical protein [Pseudomonas nunensis]|uniref:hypothetical protein n=1 Tax=Pseudomonas nunensis TaxID=2961896 RepID=UPI0025B204E7|nr:hypothetical protein [Pseudomonas nunensis]MDN3220726.1 hypothetical protein [Pseudomonas nunensis]
MKLEDLEAIRRSAWRALGPIRPTDSNTKADKNFLLNGKKTNAGRDLPPYYLVYFLLVDLLGFKNLGRFEKIDWSIPIDFNGQAYLVEYGKFGLNLFAHDPEKEEHAAREITIRIQKGVKASRLFFDFLASQAIERSEINVVNNSIALHDRFEFAKDLYISKCAEIKHRDNEYALKRKQRELPFGFYIGPPSSNLKEEANWLAISAIESFFSWTEHVLIHLAILIGSVVSAREVADLATADWSKKFKTVFKLNDKKEKTLFDEALSLRQELRNFIAHGAFGKQGEAFSFHSTAGAVPVLLPHNRGSKKFSLGEQLEFDADVAFDIINVFIQALWSKERAPAHLYIQMSRLPTILTFVTDGTYARAMTSLESMEELIEYLSNMVDQAANMDW